MPELKDKPEGHGSPVNLAICVPSQDFWYADFAISVMSMHQLLHYHPLSEDFKHNLINERGSLITYQRENLADRAVDSGATHILWLDSDMKFQPNLIHRLFKHDLPVVACNYVKRIVPAMPNTKSHDGKLIATGRDSHGLVEAKSTGFGAVLMKTQVLKDIPKPWFDLVWLDKGDDEKPELMGEDVFFFRKMFHFTDYKLMIDHDASQHVSHIGSFEYSNALADATWDEVDMDDTKEKIMA